MPTLSTDNLLPKIVQWQCAVKRLFTSILFASSMDFQKMHLRGIFRTFSHPSSLHPLNKPDICARPLITGGQGQGWGAGRQWAGQT